MRFMLAAALLVAATACDTKKVDRPVPPPNEEVEEKDTIYVDSLEVSSIYHPASFGATVQVADSGSYRVHYSLATAPVTGDTIQLRVGRDSIANYGKMAVLITRRTTQRDSATFKVQRVYGASVKWYACRRVLRGGTQIIPEKCQTWNTNLPPRQPDSVWVDSMLAITNLDAKPDTIKITETTWRKLNIYKRPDGQLTDSMGKLWGFTCPAGDRCPKVQFCGFVVFKDGKVAMRDKQSTECAGEYNKLPSAKRAVSGEQQLVANAVCMKWDATGGTITPEVCPGQPAWLRQYVPTYAFNDTTIIELEAPPPPRQAPEYRT